MGKQNFDNDERNKRSIEVWDKFINYMLEQAPKSADHTEDVLEEFCFAVEGGTAPDWRILDYLAKLFRSRIEENDTKLFAMLTKTPQRSGRTTKRRRDKNSDRDIEIARKVARHMHYGMTREYAFGEVVNTTGLKHTMVKRAYEKYGKFVRQAKID